MKHIALLLCLALAAACDYDPPPDVVTFACENNNCVLGEPIVLTFSEPVKKDSLSLSVWPDEKDSYDLEGQRLASVKPLAQGCTPTKACGEADGLVLTLDDARTTLSIAVAPGALGPPNLPLVLELAGTLEDDKGRTLDVVRRYPFQMVPGAFVPPSDTAGGDTSGDTAAPEPLGVKEGPFLWFAEVNTPLGFTLPQQFYGNIQVDQESGKFYALMTDADPTGDSPRNTSDPALLTMDLGVEGFIFLVHGTITRQPGYLGFESEPFTLALKIGPITFALRDSVMRGTISTDEEGLDRWDGTLAVNELFIDTGSSPQTYPAQQDSFIMFQLTAEQVPENQPQVCEDEPCADLQGEQCTIEVEPWPPADACPDDDAPAAD